MWDAFYSKSKQLANYVFTKHPEEQSMSYFEHLKHACGFSVQALGCSIVFMIHGIVPCLFENTGSVMAASLHGQLQGTPPRENEKINQD